MYSVWRPGAANLGSMYQDGSRFSLRGWTAAEWTTFFEGAGSTFSQVYGTIAHQPAVAPPAPIVATPIGAVPTWAILGLIAVGGLVLLSSRISRPSRRRRR